MCFKTNHEKKQKNPKRKEKAASLEDWFKQPNKLKHKKLCVIWWKIQYSSNSPILKKLVQFQKETKTKNYWTCRAKSKHHISITITHYLAFSCNATIHY